LLATLAGSPLIWSALRAVKTRFIGVRAARSSLALHKVVSPYSATACRYTAFRSRLLRWRRSSLAQGALTARRAPFFSGGDKVARTAP